MKLSNRIINIGFIGLAIISISNAINGTFTSKSVKIKTIHDTVYVSKKIVSKVYEDNRVSKPSAYEDATKYKIRVYNGRYIAELPHGNTLGSYNSLEDAQAAINENVEISRNYRIERGSFF